MPDSLECCPRRCAAASTRAITFCYASLGITSRGIPSLRSALRVPLDVNRRAAKKPSHDVDTLDSATCAITVTHSQQSLIVNHPALAGHGGAKTSEHSLRSKTSEPSATPSNEHEGTAALAYVPPMSQTSKRDSRPTVTSAHLSRFFIWCILVHIGV